MFKEATRMDQKKRISFARRALSWYRTYISRTSGVHHNLLTTTTQELFVLTTLIAILIVMWQHIDTTIIGDNPYEVLRDISDGAFSYFNFLRE